MRRCPTCGRRLEQQEKSGLAFPKIKRAKGRGCAGYLRDSAAKERLGYTNPRSYVRLDGSEVLFAEDWRKRKRELRTRSGGRCEVMLEIIGIEPTRCTAEAADPHHKIKRSNYRDDRMENLIAACRPHHDMLDERRPKWTRRGSKAAD